MNRTYTILLGSLIACTSMGMDDAVEEAPSKVPSLVVLATKGLAKNIDLQVGEDVEMLKKDNQLTRENVYTKILNRFAELPLSEDSDRVPAIVGAYKEIYKVRDTEDQVRTQILQHEYPIVCWKASTDKSQIAVITRFHSAHYKLHIWHELLSGFKKTEYSWFREPVREIEWGPDNDLIVVTEDNVAILKKQENRFVCNDNGSVEKKESRFTCSYSASLRYKEVIGRLLWSSEHKKLAIVRGMENGEKKRPFIDMYGIVNNQLTYRHTIDLWEKGEFVVGDIGFGADGKLQVTRTNVLSRIVETLSEMTRDKLIIKQDDWKLAVRTQLPSLDAIAEYLVNAESKK